MRYLAWVLVAAGCGGPMIDSPQRAAREQLERRVVDLVAQQKTDDLQPRDIADLFALTSRFPDSPYTPIAWLALGETAFAHENYAKALEQFGRVQSRNLRPYAAYRTAWTDYNLGDTQSARLAFVEAFQRSADSPHADELRTAICHDAFQLFTGAADQLPAGCAALLGASEPPAIAERPDDPEELGSATDASAQDGAGSATMNGAVALDSDADAQAATAAATVAFTPPTLPKLPTLPAIPKLPTLPTLPKLPTLPASPVGAAPTGPDSGTDSE
jgi:tetratricopeptide (TPR) repeat protein